MSTGQAVLLAFIACIVAGSFDGWMVTIRHSKNPVWVFFCGIMLVLAFLLSVTLYGMLDP